jgi:hypothetical protein
MQGVPQLSRWDCSLHLRRPSIYNVEALVSMVVEDLPRPLVSLDTRDFATVEHAIYFRKRLIYCSLPEGVLSLVFTDCQEVLPLFGDQGFGRHL